MKSIEYERKYAVDHKLLPPLSQPWVFVQGYSPDGNSSMRVIPACASSFLRIKDDGFGIRAKDSRRLAYAKGVQRLQEMPGAVTKLRHIVDTPGRRYLVDYLPESDVWHAETEFPTSEEFWAGLTEETPNWLGDELTWLPEGYTKNFSQPRTLRELDSLMNHAAVTGCPEPYDPDAIFGAH